MRDYRFASMIAASCGAAFTAAAAAWRSVRLNLKESRARTEPFIAVGIPRRDPPGARIVVPLKNLGLGPARLITLQLLVEGIPWSARIAPGLGPMESEDLPSTKTMERPETRDPAEILREGQTLCGSQVAFTLDGLADSSDLGGRSAHRVEEGSVSSGPIEQDLAQFGRISATVQEEYRPAGGVDPWEASPFGWIKKESSRRRGAIGERLVQAWAREVGLRVTGRSDSGHDCRIEDVAVEVKFSTLWEGGNFTFQQIRDQSYAVAALLGLEPQAVHLWFLPKEMLWDNAVGQHTGAAAHDTKWLTFAAASPPTWLAPYGGRLDHALSAVRALISPRS